MANVHPHSMGITIQCTKCQKTAVGLSGHVGKRHKRCLPRKPGFPYDKQSGTWRSA